MPCGMRPVIRPGCPGQPEEAKIVRRLIMERVDDISQIGDASPK